MQPGQQERETSRVNGLGPLRDPTHQQCGQSAHEGWMRRRMMKKKKSEIPLMPVLTLM